MYRQRCYMPIIKKVLKYYYINNYSNVCLDIGGGGNDGGGGGGGGGVAFVVICGLLYYTIGK